MINELRLYNATVNLQYLYDLKNLLFLNRQLAPRKQELEKGMMDYELVNKANNDVIWDYDVAKDE